MSHLTQLNAIDPEAVKKAQEAGPSTQLLEIIATMFQALSDQTRVKILYALLQQPLCVRDLAVTIGASESLISHHLRLLKDRHLVKSKRDGTVVNYSIAGNHLAALFMEAEYHASHVFEGIPDHPYTLPRE